MFFWNSCFFNGPEDVGNLISGSSAFSKTSLNIWKFMVHVLLKPGLNSILESRDTTLPTKVHLVKAMVFPVVMYACKLDYKESWAPKNWCFWPVVLEKTLESPLDFKEIHQSILKEINPAYSFEGLMLKLKFQFFGHMMWRADSLEKTLMLGKTRAWGERGWRGWDGWMTSFIQWTWIWANSER